MKTTILYPDNTPKKKPEGMMEALERLKPAVQRGCCLFYHKGSGHYALLRAFPSADMYRDRISRLVWLNKNPSDCLVDPRSSSMQGRFDWDESEAFGDRPWEWVEATHKVTLSNTPEE